MTKYLVFVLGVLVQIKHSTSWFAVVPLSQVGASSHLECLIH